MFTSYDYDPCRDWVKKKRNRGVGWEELRFAGKKNDDGLRKFLEGKVEDDYWPEDMNVAKWKQFIESLEKDESRRIYLQNANRMAELHDGHSETNRVYVPDGDRSSWQLYRKHLLENKGFTEDAVQKIEIASIGILKRLSSDTIQSGPVKGLVVGSVQSGKTANMAALMAMAADWGFNMFIVLSGTIESLRKQTQSRLFNDLSHPGYIQWIQFDHLAKKRCPIGQRLSDLHFGDDQNVRSAYMTVCLKVKSRLENLIEWIEDDRKNIQNLRILVIDDEADQAGINTGDVYTDSERKTINRLILNLVHCRDKKAVSNATNRYTSHYQAMNYVSYTATPYANCLNEVGPETLYPANFIRTLDVSSSYFGPTRYFGKQDADDNGQLDVVRCVPDEDVCGIRELQRTGRGALPQSLKDAVCWFLCATSVMRYYQYKKPVSMLIHTSQKQTDHFAIASAVQSWIQSNRDGILARCRSIYEEEKSRLTKVQFRICYEDYEHPDEEIWDYPEFDLIEDLINELTGEINSIKMDDEGDLRYCRGIHLCVDNCACNGVNDKGVHMRLAYPDEKNPDKPDFATAFIVIGGNTLSRGLTLEGLVSTFFLRSVKQMDTLMQMGRWFGYRTHYELLPRIWLTRDTERKFELLTEVDEDLREQIYQMQLAGMSPEKFNLALMTSPKVSWLSLTSKKKMQMATPAAVDFSGMDTQLTVYSKSGVEQIKNIQAAEAFIRYLGDGFTKSTNTEAYIWKSVSFDKIISEFLKKYQVPETSRSFQQLDLLEEWVQKQTEKGELKNWNVILRGISVTDQMPRDQIFTFPYDIRIGKIHRSCKVDSGDHVNIGVLSGKKDYVADITQDMLPLDMWNEMVSGRSINNRYNDFRRSAGVGNTPLFLIYVIDRHSKAVLRSRQPLNMEHDLIGITMVVPGIRGTHGAVTRLKVRIPENIQEVED